MRLVSEEMCEVSSPRVWVLIHISQFGSILIQFDSNSFE